MTTMPDDPYRPLSEHELDALPVGTVRNWDLAGVRVTLQKQGDGRWQVRARGDVPSYVLARLKSRPAGRVSAPRAAATPVQRTAAQADRVTAMYRVAKASGL